MKYTHQERRNKMKLMNLFNRKGESSETSFGSNDKSSKAFFISKEDYDEDKIHSKEFKELAVTLAKKIGIEKAAEELKVPASSIRSWQKAFDIYALAQNTTSSQSNKEPNDSTDKYEFGSLAQNTNTPIQDEYEFSALAQNTNAPIQDEYGVLRFSLEGKTYSLNVNSKEERERVKEEVNANSLVQYDWFDEETGEEHWVLYNTEMYEIKDFHLHYKEGSLLAPVIPINATSCYAMFRDCSHLPTLNFSDFDTSNVVDMDYMFARCSNFITLDHDGLFHFYPIFVCDWPQVLKRVEYRLCNNLEKNFSICYGDTNALKATLRSYGYINPTFTSAAFNSNGTIVYLDIDTKYDDSSTLIETDAGYITVKDKLTITYCNVSTKEYIDSRNTCKHSYCIPNKSLENWVDFKELWYKTFDMEICPYKILHSKGVKRL